MFINVNVGWKPQDLKLDAVIRCFQEGLPGLIAGPPGTVPSKPIPQGDPRALEEWIKQPQVHPQLQEAATRFQANAQRITALFMLPNFFGMEIGKLVVYWFSLNWRMSARALRTLGPEGCVLGRHAGML